LSVASTPSLNKRQRMIVEQVYYGRNTPGALMEYLSVGKKSPIREDNFRRTMKPILRTGIVEESDGRYTLSEENIDREFLRAGGLDNLHRYLPGIRRESADYEKEGEKINLERSEKKIEAHLRGEIAREELTEWERDQAQGRRLVNVAKKGSNGRPSAGGISKEMMRHE
jgi:hypothetical protein